MKFFSILIALVVCQFTASSQPLPSQWHKDNYTHILRSGDLLSEGLYDESKMEEIRLYFPQTNYWNLLTQNYNSKTDIPARLNYKGTDYDSVGVRFKGQTSYFMNTSQKKSFNISMDYVSADQKLEGYKTLNLNNSWTDPSFMREVLYYRLIRQHTPAAKTNFVRLYINDQDWGVYQNVQQLNKDFLEEWYETNDGINIRADRPDGSSNGPGGPGGQWGDGTAGLNYLGTDTLEYQKYYTLKSSDQKDPWQQLIQACNILNTTTVANLTNIAPEYFDIDKILWHLACEIAFGDDDSYVFKGKMDYYLYQDAETGRWSTYDYDANSTFVTSHVNWSPFYNANKVNYPLLNKLLAVPSFRQRYLAHMRTIIAELFDESKVNALIDQYHGLINTAVFADTKKTTSNTSYTNEQNTLKNFIKNRKAYLLTNTEVKAASPSISEAAYYVDGNKWGDVTPDKEALITAKISFTGLNNVLLHYAEGFSGLFYTSDMYDDGTHGDITANDGVYSTSLPSFSAGTMIRYYVEAIGSDGAGSRSYYPSGSEHQVLFFEVKTGSSNAITVVVNEFMASNDGIILDEAGEAEDWIELYNTTNQNIDLSGYFITDNPLNLTKFEFPAGTTLAPDSYLIIWADEDQEQGPLHVNFKLSAGGEFIMLLDPNKVIVDSIAYGAQVTDKTAARIPNGTGPFVIGNHTFNANNDGTSATGDEINITQTIRPNPASDVIYVPNQKENVSIYDMNGTMVQCSTPDPLGTIGISELKTGMYIVRSGAVSQKLVVMR
ncbi:MAG: CotH kinase family protein [Saprospiraceae bacterium]|nr:CotH kinase family protein [Saprospiraceae bacterium]